MWAVTELSLRRMREGTFYLLILIGIVVYVIIRYKRGEIGPDAENTAALDDFDDDFDADGGIPGIGEKPLTYDGSNKDGNV